MGDPHLGRTSTHREGRLGEEVAARYLESAGWTILGRNVRHGRREVDLVAFREGVLAFVEVKARRGDGFGHPLEAITPLKRREIARVARGWLRANPIPVALIRFDAVAVHLRRGRPPVVDHVEDAWRE